jgi:flagellin
MNTITDMLQRMRELAVQAANSTNTTGAGGDIDKLNDEYTQLGAEIERNLQSVQFNGQSLLSGVTNDFTFQVGANSGSTQQIVVSAANINIGTGAISSVFGAGGASALDISAHGNNASANLTAIDEAISAVNTARAKLGAVQSRFENTINFLRSASENQSAAKGRIMDADFAAETANLSRTQILQQAGTAMIAQANQVPQNVLSLIR